ncbi:polysaccharide deacetylase family protein [Nitrosomonas sp.]|uniref:polysaccharide deacetylase family protein n=1 Tax=Nitrosomonas sp. TaxID=42353 RepID=UPI001D645205|nr:polysaccharide deacetylase family protein [Nitrosomonas sp.]MCB1947493.1 polysaccharide deacetylase family protein [Nitrosomonas sp.]MCP5244272.1 polysaccharide deacetylase family protein [Burkholderiales bacterium]MDR4514979.1 polysaccharide deacetylase family protein [Nitrosomonas sp.]
MRATILMYHMIDTPVTPAETRFCRTPENFRKDMQLIRSAGYNVVPLKTLLDALVKKTRLPDKALVITFDDGLACNHDNALPILQEFDFTASIFVVTGKIGGHNDFSRPYGFSRRRMLTATEIRSLTEAGIDIGSHTVSHLMLGKTEIQTAINEIRNSKAILEDILGQKVSHFAYPFGSWNPDIRDAVMSAGYAGACSTMPWQNRLDTDPYLLRRSEIKGHDTSWQFRLKLRFATNTMPPVAETRHAARRFLEKTGLIPSRKR